MSIVSNPLVVNSVLRRFNIVGLGDLQMAAQLLSQSLSLSMQFPAAYQAPVDQALPQEVSLEDLATVVHPFNVASALVSVVDAAQAHFAVPLAIDPNLQVYLTNPPGWTQLLALRAHVPTAQIAIAPPPAPPAPAPAPAPPPAPPAAPPPAPPAADITSLVDVALGTTAQVDPASLASPATTAANPVPVTSHAPPAPAAAPHSPPTPAEVLARFPNGIVTEQDFAEYRAMMTGTAPPAPPAPVASTDPHAQHPGVQAAVAAVQQATAAPAAPERTVGMPPELGAPYGQTAQGVAGPAHVTLEQAKAEGAKAVLLGVGLPDPSVTASRVGPSGKDQKSPFLGKIELRKKLAEAPWWWPHMLHTAPRLFVDTPAQALDPSSTGTGPVQAYAALLALVSEVLRTADPALTVAELRTYLGEVATGIEALEGAEGALQLAEVLFKPAA